MDIHTRSILGMSVSALVRCFVIISGLAAVLTVYFSPSEKINE